MVHRERVISPWRTTKKNPDMCLPIFFCFACGNVMCGDRPTDRPYNPSSVSGGGRPLCSGEGRRRDWPREQLFKKNKSPISTVVQVLSKYILNYWWKPYQTHARTSLPFSPYFFLLHPRDPFRRGLPFLLLLLLRLSRKSNGFPLSHAHI